MKDVQKWLSMVREHEYGACKDTCKKLPTYNKRKLNIIQELPHEKWYY